MPAPQLPATISTVTSLRTDMQTSDWTTAGQTSRLSVADAARALGSDEVKQTLKQLLHRRWVQQETLFCEY